MLIVNGHCTTVRCLTLCFELREWYNSSMPFVGNQIQEQANVYFQMSNVTNTELCSKQWPKSTLYIYTHWERFAAFAGQWQRTDNKNIFTGVISPFHCTENKSIVFLVCILRSFRPNERKEKQKQKTIETAYSYS